MMSGEGPEPANPRITLPDEDWDRVLMALAVYANRVEENGDEALAGEVRLVGREIASQLPEVDQHV